MWAKTHNDIVTLVMLAGWKPWDVKRMSYRDRRFWADWYQAIEDRKVMQDVTRPA